MIIKRRDRDRVIALAALVQAVTLVQYIAQTGRCETDDIIPLFNSLMATDAPSTEAVFGDLAKLKTGFVKLNTLLSKSKNKNDVILLRYLVTLFHLERQLARQPAMMEIIRREIEQMPQQINYFGSITDRHVIARFANIYQQTISQLTPRIQVLGDQAFLQQAEHVDQIRALLLTAIRSAVLWHQKGGRRWQFIFQSSKLLKISTEITKTID